MDRKLIPTLAELAFTEAGQNVVLVGGPGTGKTHLATAVGVSGITRHGKRVRFYSTVDLVNALEQEKSQGKAGRIALSLLRMDLVILDEWGCLPVSHAVGALLFHLLSRLYEHTNMMITTNLDFATARHRHRHPQRPPAGHGRGPHRRARWQVVRARHHHLPGIRPANAHGLKPCVTSVTGPDAPVNPG